MKRYRFGINLDGGVPLASESDFEQLYVECSHETVEILTSWIKEGDSPLLLGGQIGSGKSTLIKKAFRDSSQEPEISLHFDRESINLDAGDFWAITLAGFIDAALKEGIDLSFCNLPEELGGFQPGDWRTLLNSLSPKKLSMDSFTVKTTLRRKIAKEEEYIREITAEIGKRLKKRRQIFIFASGLDKFETSSAAFFALKEVIQFLSMFKTLYEVNAIHFFSRIGVEFRLEDRLFIPTMEQDFVVEMLTKRMGNYADNFHEEINILAQWSGGNPRQALRLLSHFETANKSRKRNRADNIAFAIRETAGDFFSFTPKPSTDLIRTIQKTKTIDTALFYLPGDKDTARRALYGNWLLIKKMGNSTKWPAEINPLVKTAFAKTFEPEKPEEPEIRFLKEFAKKMDISPTGLSFGYSNDENREEISTDRVLWDLLKSGVEQPIETNLDEIFNILSGALLSKDRADRSIIAYKEDNIVTAARAYLFAKANTYESQRCSHFILEGGSEKNPIEEIEKILDEDTDIFSFEFAGGWTRDQLIALDKQRDRFLDYQMLWWIRFEDLKKYLPYWIHLRQLFETFVLEDELLGSISDEEIIANMDFFRNLTVDGDEQGESVIENLKLVLAYLKEARGVNGNG